MEYVNCWRNAWKATEIDGKLLGGKADENIYKEQGLITEVCS